MIKFNYGEIDVSGDEPHNMKVSIHDIIDLREFNDFYSKMKNIPINIDYSLAEFVLPHEKYLMYSVNNYIIPEEWKKNFNINMLTMIHNKYNTKEIKEDCIERVYKFINHIKNKYINTNKNILIITHMSIVNIILHLSSNKINYNNLDVDKYYPMGLITEINLI